MGLSILRVPFSYYNRQGSRATDARAGVFVFLQGPLWANPFSLSLPGSTPPG